MQTFISVVQYNHRIIQKSENITFFGPMIVDVSSSNDSLDYTTDDVVQLLTFLQCC